MFSGSCLVSSWTSLSSWQKGLALMALKEQLNLFQSSLSMAILPSPIARLTFVLSSLLIKVWATCVWRNALFYFLFRDRNFREPKKKKRRICKLSFFFLLPSIFMTPKGLYMTIIWKLNAAAVGLGQLPCQCLCQVLTVKRKNMRQKEVEKCT